MTARVFAESTDVLQDQARILFDYLNKAAERIVEEELRIEKEIADKTAELAEAGRSVRGKNQAMIALFVLAGIALGLGFMSKGFFFLFFCLLIAAVIVLSQKMAAKGTAERLKQNIEVFNEEFKAIRRDYKIHRLGVAYVPVATRVPFEGKSFLLDHTQSVAAQEFNLYNVKNQGAFVRNIQELEQALGAIPLVEAAQSVETVDTADYSKSIQQIAYYDFLGGIDRNMRAASFYLNDLERYSVSMPVIDPHGDYADFLRRHAAGEAAFGPVVPVFRTDANKDDLDKFQALNEMKKSMEGQAAQFEDFLASLMERMAAMIQVVTSVKLASTDRLVATANDVLLTGLKSAYTHYSPQLESEEIERIAQERFDYQDSVESYRPLELKKSSRVKYDLVSGNWVSEDGQRTNFPFGVHQIHEEIIAPLVKNLMRETRIERLKIYNSIKDQKLDYLNQWHRDTDDFYGRNRAAGSDLINLMQASLSEFTAAFNQYKAFDETQKAMAASGKLGDAQVAAKGSEAESVAVYEKKSEEFRQIQQEFNDYADRLKEEIDRRAVEFGYIEYYDASLRDGESRDFASAMAGMDRLDRRRQSLLAANPHFAATAELPPVPDLGEQVQDGLALNLIQRVKEVRAASAAATETKAETAPAGSVAAAAQAESGWVPPAPPTDGTDGEEEWQPPLPPNPDPSDESR